MLVALLLRRRAPARRSQVKPAPPVEASTTRRSTETHAVTGRYTRDSLDTDSCLRQRVVYFDLDQTRSSRSSRPQIACHAEYLRQFPEARVRLEGNADERGSREYNLGLGERRGNAVSERAAGQRWFVRQLNVVSYGEERPVCRRARRVVLVEEPSRRDRLHGEVSMMRMANSDFALSVLASRSSCRRVPALRATAQPRRARRALEQQARDKARRQPSTGQPDAAAAVGSAAAAGPGRGAAAPAAERAGQEQARSTTRAGRDLDARLATHRRPAAVQTAVPRRRPAHPPRRAAQATARRTPRRPCAATQAASRRCGRRTHGLRRGLRRAEGRRLRANRRRSSSSSCATIRRHVLAERAVLARRDVLRHAELRARAGTVPDRCCSRYPTHDKAPGRAAQGRLPPVRA